MAQNQNSDIMLNANYNDIVLKNFDLVLTQDVNATLQRINVALKLFFGEWFLDPEFGIDYYGEVLVKNPDLLAIEALLVEQISQIPLVSGVNGLEFNFDSAERVLTVTTDIQVNDASEVLNIDIGI